MHARTRTLLTRILPPAAALAVLALGIYGCESAPGPVTVPADADLSWVRYDAPTTSEARTESQTFALDGKKGGTVTFRHVSVTFPPKAVMGSYDVTISQPDPTVAIWDLAISPPTAFKKDVTLTVDYAGFSSGEVHTLWWLDPDADVWVDLGGADNTASKSISVEIGHFSVYGVSDGTAGWE